MSESSSKWGTGNPWNWDAVPPPADTTREAAGDSSAEHLAASALDHTHSSDGPDPNALGALDGRLGADEDVGAMALAPGKNEKGSAFDESFGALAGTVATASVFDTPPSRSADAPHPAAGAAPGPAEATVPVAGKPESRPFPDQTPGASRDDSAAYTFMPPGAPDRYSKRVIDIPAGDVPPQGHAPEDPHEGLLDQDLKDMGYTLDPVRGDPELGIRYWKEPAEQDVRYWNPAPGERPKPDGWTPRVSSHQKVAAFGTDSPAVNDILGPCLQAQAEDLARRDGRGAIVVIDFEANGKRFSPLATSQNPEAYTTVSMSVRDFVARLDTDQQADAISASASGDSQDRRTRDAYAGMIKTVGAAIEGAQGFKATPEQLRDGIRVWRDRAYATSETERQDAAGSYGAAYTLPRPVREAVKEAYNQPVKDAWAQQVPGMGDFMDGAFPGNSTTNRAPDSAEVFTPPPGVTAIYVCPEGLSMDSITTQRSLLSNAALTIFDDNTLGMRVRRLICKDADDGTPQAAEQLMASASSFRLPTVVSVRNPSDRTAVLTGDADIGIATQVSATQARAIVPQLPRIPRSTVASVNSSETGNESSGGSGGTSGSGKPWSTEAEQVSGNRGRSNGAGMAYGDSATRNFTEDSLLSERELQQTRRGEAVVFPFHVNDEDYVDLAAHSLHTGERLRNAQLPDPNAHRYADTRSDIDRIRVENDYERGQPLMTPPTDPRHATSAQVSIEASEDWRGQARPARPNRGDSGDSNSNSWEEMRRTTNEVQQPPRINNPEYAIGQDWDATHRGQRRRGPEWRAFHAERMRVYRPERG